MTAEQQTPEVPAQTAATAVPANPLKGFRLVVEEAVKISVNVKPFGHIDGPKFTHTDEIPLIHTGEILKFDHNGVTVTVTLKGPGE